MIIVAVHFFFRIFAVVIYLKNEDKYDTTRTKK